MSDRATPRGYSVYKPAKTKNRRGSKWLISYRDELGNSKTITGLTDKSLTNEMAINLKNKHERQKAGIDDTEEIQYKKPIQKHIGEFIGSLEAKKRSKSYTEQVKSRIEFAITGCNIKTLGAVEPVVIEQYLNRKIRGLRTRNEYITSLRTFTKWLMKMRRTRINLLEGLSKVDARDVEIHREHPRRALRFDELLRLFDAAERRPLLEAQTIRTGKNKGKPLAKLSEAAKRKYTQLGKIRRWTYIVAFWSGLRRRELGELQWGDVDLGKKLITLRPEATKSRRMDTVPIHPDALEALYQLKPTNPNSRDRVCTQIPSSRCMRADLKLAGIEFKELRNGRYEFVDFHALRKSLNSLLASQGMDKRVAQAMLRHADSRLIDSVYLDHSQLPISETLQKIPGLSHSSVSKSSDSDQSPAQSKSVREGPNGSQTVSEGIQPKEQTNDR